MATKSELQSALKNPNVRKLLDVIAKAEKADYNTSFGGQKFNDYSKHPNIQKSFTQTDGVKNSSGAAGRYQFLKGTWDTVSRRLGLKDFSPENQDLAAVALISGRGALDDALKGNIRGAIGKLGGEWASLPSSNYNQPKRSWSEIEGMIGDIKQPNRQPAQDKINRLVTEHDRLVKKQEAPKAKTPDQINQGVSRLLTAYDSKQSQQPRIASNAPQGGGLPDFDPQGNIIEPTQQQVAPQVERTVGQQLGALPETALSLGSSIIGAPIGQAIGTFKGAAKSLIDGTFGTQEGGQQILQEANKMSQALTYEPSNAVSQEQLQSVGNVIEDTGLNTLPPVLGGLGSATGTLAKAGAPQAISTAREAAQAAAPIVQNVAQTAAKPIVNAGQAVRSGVGKVAETLGLAEAQQQRQGANMGAAQVNPASMRTEQFQDLPIPIERVTEGQVSRDPMILKGESEAAKLPVGEQFRKVQEEQHEIANMNLEKFNEMTGSELADPRAVGQTVDKALRAEMGKDKAKVKAAYNTASNSEEAKTPVDLTNRVDFTNEMIGKVTTDDGVTTTTLIDYLNDQVPSVTEPILDSAKSLAVKHGLAIKEGDALIPTVPTIKQMEAFRKDVVAKTDTMKSPDVRQATILKKLVDAHTEPYEGKLYRVARSAKRAQAKRWESNGIIKSLLGTKKGTEDRVVALEDVADKIVYKGSLDDMRVAKRLLLTSGDEGKQAWKEVQGSVIQQIKDASTAGIAADAEGRQMISPAKLNSEITKLDQDGKLDYLFGKRGADQLKSLNDVSKALFTVPMSAGINHSNTASAMAIVLDTIASGATTGLPLPLVTVLREGAKKVKDAKQRKAINKSIINLSRGSSI